MTFKGIVHPQIKIVSLPTHSHADKSGNFFFSPENTVSTFTWTVGSFDGTAVPVLVYKCQGRLDLLSDSTAVGSDVPHSAGWYLTFSWLAKQATNMLASSERNPCQTVETLTTPQRCALHIYTSFLAQIQCTLSLVLMGFLFSPRLSSTNLCCSSSRSKTPRGLLITRRLLRPTRVPLRYIHAGVIQLPNALCGCVS